MKKFIKKASKILLVLFAFVIVSFSVIGLRGYMFYKNCVDQTAIETKTSKIKESPRYTKLSDINENFTKAIVATEDKRFYSHHGFDFYATSRSLLINVKNLNIKQGGSTITQQLAKNMYFENDSNIIRKAAELFVSLELEKKYSKEDILEFYVNSIYFGDGYYGIANASWGYFKKAPKDLTLKEATLLAGLPQSPSTYALSNGKKLALERQKQVVDAMVKQALITPQEASKIIQ